MPSKIDKEERRLIDEALAEGRARTFPRGHSAFAYKWDGQRIVRDKSKTSSAIVWSGHFKLTPAVRRRRALVSKYQEEGLSLKLITQRIKDDGFNVESNHIMADLKILGLTAIPHSEYMNNMRLELFWRYFNDGVHRRKDLAALMDISESALQKFLTKNGIVLSSLRAAPADSQRTTPRKSGSDPE